MFTSDTACARMLCSASNQLDFVCGYVKKLNNVTTCFRRVQIPRGSLNSERCLTVEFTAYITPLRILNRSVFDHLVTKMIFARSRLTILTIGESVYYRHIIISIFCVAKWLKFSIAFHKAVVSSTIRARRSLILGWLGGVRLGRRTCDRAVVGSIPGRAAVKLLRSTQPSILPG